MRRKLAAGNWKMNGTSADLDQVDQIIEAHPDPAVDILIAPPATLISGMVVQAASHPLAVAGQTCHVAENGAHTGDISATMLKDAGASHVILGHSERRTDHEESDETVRAQARAALAQGLKVIVCIGETLEEREAANTLEIIAGQLASSLPDVITGENTVIAYEPVWAIGTGKTPTLDEIGDVHDYIRSRLEQRYGSGVGKSIRLLYGGSVKGSNAAEIFDVSNVDGALVGGASLTCADFSPIISALENSIQT
ncbi:triose-phosphate isomerase [Litoreibacter roseus]|uniref:Triosephosphate isomerase n=1 Tax=Litoreibacter roseus TaxID=2601869 RepID=A0A6N6JHU2_9RHOB|nr:triose-phosphate isomerase [Litoreibacter roseus]GFE65836.1 triosephosphate isomerase [Litoreibacter roseus]